MGGSPHIQTIYYWKIWKQFPSDPLAIESHSTLPLRVQAGCQLSHYNYRLGCRLGSSQSTLPGRACLHGLACSGVGYFGSGWVTSVGGEGFRDSHGGLLRGGLLQGYFHHRLRLVTLAHLRALDSYRKVRNPGLEALWIESQGWKSIMICTSNCK